MQVFAFDPADHRDTFERQGWVHIPGGVTPEFLEAVRTFVRGSFDDTRLASRAVPGKKEQSLFAFPYADYEGELGVSIQIPAASQLVMYPFDHLELNPFNRAAELYDSLAPGEKPEIVMRTAREVVVDDHDGDVVAFYGKTTRHLRRSSANSYNLYLKFNDFDCDPPGGNPATPLRREDTLAALDGDITGLVPVVSRRLSEFALLRSLNGDRDVASLCDTEAAV